MSSSTKVFKNLREALIYLVFITIFSSVILYQLDLTTSKKVSDTVKGRLDLVVKDFSHIK